MDDLPDPEQETRMLICLSPSGTKTTPAQLAILESSGIDVLFMEPTAFIVRGSDAILNKLQKENDWISSISLFNAEAW